VPEFTRELSIWADFNSLDAERRIKASLRFSDSPDRPHEGEWVRLHDDEGNAVRGVVENIDGMIIRVRPAMETWSSEVSLPAFAQPLPYSAPLVKASQTAVD
jgi:hypothetical protein